VPTFFFSYSDPFFYQTVEIYFLFKLYHFLLPSVNNFAQKERAAKQFRRFTHIAFRPFGSIAQWIYKFSFIFKILY
jgi:hypothetical protein